MSSLVTVRDNDAESPTLISAKVRFSIIVIRRPLPVDAESGPVGSARSRPAIRGGGPGLDAQARLYPGSSTPARINAESGPDGRVQFAPSNRGGSGAVPERRA